MACERTFLDIFYQQRMKVDNDYFLFHEIANCRMELIWVLTVVVSLWQNAAKILV